MKKVLIGICGLGRGHLERQKNIISLLSKLDVDIAIATSEENFDFLREIYNYKLIKVSVPFIVCNEYGVDYSASLKFLNERKVDYFKSFLSFAIEVEKYFSGKPDLVLTDYEPNVAKYSYSAGIPLICLEQQSKFFYVDELKIDGYSISEEKFRLNYFFPKYDFRIISSFFPIDVKNQQNVIIVPPIIKKIQRLEPKKKIIVYLSPYDTENRRLKQILEPLCRIPGYSIHIYSSLGKLHSNHKNICFSSFSESFDKDISDAEIIIATSGHQLISEAVSLNVPMLLMPLKTYEQNYNLEMVKKYKLGEKIMFFDENEIESFLQNKQAYIKSIIGFKKKYWRLSWEEMVKSVLVNRYNFTEKQ